MREAPHITEEHLRSSFQEQYDLVPVTIELLPGGLDYYARVYRVISENGTPYLLKVKSGELYEPACLVPGYLRDQGITAVVAPLPTKKNTLWTQLGDWTMIVYPFHAGETSWEGMTDEQWRTTGAIFKQLHSVTLPPSGFESLRKETFDPMNYTSWVRNFETQLAHVRDNGSAAERTLRSSWVTHQSKIHEAISSLEKLAEALQRQTSPYVISHADLHPANLIRDQAGHVFVIDWDEVMLAPKERDFIFVKEPQTASSTWQDLPPFFQGYGQAEINWRVLTYYRWERVVQDLIVGAQNVCFRDDWEEETRADATRLFQQVLTEEGSIDAAYAAAAHIPRENFPHRETP